MSFQDYDGMRRQQQEEQDRRNADRARTFNPQGVSLSGPSVAFREPDDPEGPAKPGWGRMFLHNFAKNIPGAGLISALPGVADFVGENIKGAARGTIGGVDAGVESVIGLGGLVASATGAGEAFGGEDFLDWWAQDADERNPLHIGKDIIAAPETLIGGLTEGIFQAGVGLIGVGKFATAVKATRAGVALLRGGQAASKAVGATKAGAQLTRIGNTTVGKWAKGATKGMATGAVIDAAFFDPQEERLANLVANSPSWFGSALTDYMAETDAVQFLMAKEEDSEAAGRFKNALEGLLLGGAIGTVMHMVNVQSLRWQGKKAEAADLAARFMPQDVHEVVELPNGKFRLGMHEGDKAMLTEHRPSEPRGPDPHLDGLDVIDTGTGGEFRVFLYDTPEGKGAIGGVERNGTFEVERMGRWDADAEEILIHKGEKANVPGARGPDAWEAEMRTRMPQFIKDWEAAGFEGAAAIKKAEEFVQARREHVVMGQLDDTFQNSLTREKMMTLGAELYSYMPNLDAIFGPLRVKSGEPFRIPTHKLQQEIFGSRGDAATEALSASDGRNMRKAPVDRLAKDQVTEAHDLGELHGSNRTARTIRKAEDKFIHRLRTNMATGAEEMVSLVSDMARIFHDVDPNGNGKVMRARGDEALSLIKSNNMEGLLKNPELAKYNPVAVRYAAGLMMRSLGSDVVRYTRRTNQGGSNLSYLQLGRALDQMMHVEEMLTGKPAIWFEKHKRLYDAGAFDHSPGKKVSNTDMPEGPMKGDVADVEAPAVDADGFPFKTKQEAIDAGHDPDASIDDGGTGPSMEAEALMREGEEIRSDQRQAEFDQPGGVNDPMGPPTPPAHMLAGVAPGPKSLRNLSKPEIQRLGRFIALADGDPSAIMVALKAARLEVAAANRGGGFGEALVRYRMAAMLSGWGTHAVNIVSTGLQTGLKPAELMIGGALTGQPKYIIEGAYRMQGLLSEQGDAWRAMSRAWKTGKGSLDAGFMTRELDAGRAKGALAFTNIPQDLLTASDEFFKVLNYRSHVRAKSLTASAEAGLSHADAAKRMVGDLESSMTADGVGLQQAALEYSRNATFTDDVGKVAGAVTSIRDNIPGQVGKIFVPFIRTPNNIAKNIVVRSPLALANMKAHRAAMQAGGEVAAERAGRMAVAAAMTGTAGLLIESGRITGRGPQNPDTRAAWLLAGNEPYTILTADGTKIHYNKLSSFFGPMAIIADAYMASGNLKSVEEVQVGIMQVTASLMNYVADQSYIGNAGEGMDVLLSGSGAKITEYAQKVAAGMIVPKAISQFTAMDDQMREAEGFVEDLMKLTPGLSDELPPARNIFREPIFKAPGSMDRLLNPFTSLGQTDTAVAMRLFRVGKNLALPGDTKFGGRIDLKDTDKWGEVDGMSPYEYWLEKTAESDWAGQTLKQQLSEAVMSPDWFDMPEGSEDWPGGPRYELVARIVQTAQDIAWTEVMEKFGGTEAPGADLQMAMVNEQVLKGLGASGGKNATDEYLENLEQE